MATGQTGYQPRNTPAERRAFFDLQRRLTTLEAGGGGGGGSVNEVQVSTLQPTDPEVELWYDTDASPGPGIGVPQGYVHNQSTPLATWTVTHDLDFTPNVTVVDSGGSQVEGDVQYISASQLTVTFSAAFSGIAYLS